jgi:RHS repeat-associated protein
MIKKLTLIKLLIVTIIPFAKGQPYQPANYNTNIPQNSVKVIDAKMPFSNVADILDPSRNTEEVKKSTQYFDGFGRPIQTVNWQLSPLKKDVVTPQVYDELGREQYRFMPYVATSNDGLLKYDPFTAQNTFNNTQYNNQGETYFYNKTNFEPSPLNRPIKEMAAGNSWVGNNKGVEQQYQINTLLDGVRLWEIGHLATDIPTTTTIYPSGELYKNVSIDEHSKQIVEYKNKEGKVILKKVQIDNTPTSHHKGWYCTYYIYDVFNQLRYVIQPKAVNLLVDANWSFANLSSDVKDELCFYYQYDKQGRLIVKKVPGAGEMYMVYDERDRLVMMQDANLRLQNKWMITLYDELNRPMKTGLWQNGSDRMYHQSMADMQTSIIEYPTNSQLSAHFELLTQTGYDNYNNLPIASGLSSSLVTTNINATNFITNYNTSPNYAQPIIASITTLGLTTWTMVKVLDGAITPTYLFTLTLYDKFNRPIQIKSKNISGGQDVLTMQYDFEGKVLRTHQSHEKLNGGANIYNTLTKPSYDHAGRVLDVKKTITAIGTLAIVGVEKTIAVNAYNELGQLQTKKLAAEYNAGGASGLENLNYEYNIRGWLLGVNRNFIAATNQSPSGGNGGGYFGFELGYDKANNIVTGQTYVNAYYNGNISGVTWKSKGDNEKRKFDYVYDNSNRLLKADFTQYTNGTFNQAAGINFNVKMGDGVDYYTAYDENGNIKQMQQWGIKGLISSQIDNLAYNYIGNSNKLLNVIDAVNDPNTKLGDFRSSELYNSVLPIKNATTIDYTYDVNGNLTNDKNKDIDKATGAIEYNYLNLPQKVTVNAASGVGGKGTIEYIYDASGNKLCKKVTEGIVITKTTYTSGCVYESKTGINAGEDQLQFIAHEEGRARLVIPQSEGSATFVYDYMVKDHLGNVRMVLTEEQKQDVYPATTLENLPYNGGIAVKVESRYYVIDDTKIVNRPKSMPIYQNNNGNPPYNNNPYSNTMANSSKIYKTNASTNKIGLGITLKVMAGDNVDIFGKSYHVPPPKGTFVEEDIKSTSVLEILNNLVVTNVISSKGFTGTQLQSGFPISTNSIFVGQPNSEYYWPKASINWIIFDEQFKFVSGGFDMVQKSEAGIGAFKNHQNLGINIPKNGYIYVYCSNESKYDVFFDNLQVIHNKGAILEETHYYPFGLTMAGISSRAANTLENKFKLTGKELQSKEFSDGSGLEQYDFGARFYDPQIGKWGVIDPHCQNYFSYSPYVYVGNNPILLIDPDGKDWFFHSVDGTTNATWNWHDGSEYNTGVLDNNGQEVILQGTEAVVVFMGSRNEKLGEKDGKDGYINGEGAITASVTVYGPDGANDVHTYTGYTIGSDPKRFGAIDEGTYDANYDARGKGGKIKSNWVLNSRGHIRMMDGAINPNAPSQVEENGEGYKDQIFIHTSNRDGYAGTVEKKKGVSGISVGCLLIAPSDWASFNEVMSGVTNFKVQVIRTTIEKVPLQGIKGIVPNVSVTKIKTKTD